MKSQNTKGKRKVKRRLSTKEPIHLILRLNKPYTRLVFSPFYKLGMNILKSKAEKFNIKIYNLAFNHSHLHLVIKLKSEAHYVKFIRAFAAHISAAARKYENPMRVNSAKSKLEKVFMFLPFTRVVKWGRAYKELIRYVEKNQFESLVLDQMEIFNALQLGPPRQLQFF